MRCWFTFLDSPTVDLEAQHKNIIIYIQFNWALFFLPALRYVAKPFSFEHRRRRREEKFIIVESIDGSGWLGNDVGRELIADRRGINYRLIVPEKETR